MRFIIVGCGRVGSGLAQSLSTRGHSVTIIDKDPAALGRLGPNFIGQKIAGVGFDRDVLIAAGIERIDGLAAVTSSDEVNILAAQVARRMFLVPNVIARVYDPRQAEIYNRLGLRTITSTSWGISRITEMLVYSDLDAVYSLGNGDGSLVQVDVPVTLQGKRVTDLTIPGESAVVGILRAGKFFLPTLGTEFQSGDVAYLAVLSSASSRLQALLQG